MCVKIITLSILLNIFAVHSANSQTYNDSTIIGIWKGASTCQVKSSSCNDEINIYYISKAKGIDSFSISATKIENGKEREMGVIPFKLDRKNKKLLSTADNSVWTLNIIDETIDGTLFFRGSLYRIIKLKKLH